MRNKQRVESGLVRVSETSRKQRDGSEFVGAFGKKTGSSDLVLTVDSNTVSLFKDMVEDKSSDSATTCADVLL